MKPNIIFIAVDTLRADHLGCYGYHRNTSPFLDQLAKRSAIFKNCFSQAPWTIPSFTTIMTGLYPERHRIVGSPWNVPNANSIVLDDTIPVLAEILLDAGYYTAAFDNLHQMSSHPKWFVRGFNEYINLTPRTGLWHHHLRADEINARVVPWLSEPRDKPFFLFLHYWEPHLPYNQPDSHRNLYPGKIDCPVQKLRDGRAYIPRWGEPSDMSERVLQSISNYDAEIRFFDDCLKELYEALESSNLMDNTILVVAGDHGEAMVEHGIWFNHEDLFDCTIHVPLLITGSPKFIKGSEIEDLVELVDLCPSLLDLAGVNIEERFQGKSLRPYLNTGKDQKPKEFVHAVQNGQKPCRMMCSSEWKLIERLPSVTKCTGNRPRSFELYNRKEDPEEQFDVVTEFPQVALGLQNLMNQWIAETVSRDNPLDPLIDGRFSVDFYQYPGDPVLREFYSWVGKLPSA